VQRSCRLWRSGVSLGLDRFTRPTFSSRTDSLRSSRVSPLRTAARVLACALTRPLRHAATKHWLQSKDLQTLFTIDGEGVFVLDTGATTFILTVPTLTVPDRFSCRIEGG
jgi:hypothetical protein